MKKMSSETGATKGSTEIFVFVRNGDTVSENSYAKNLKKKLSETGAP